MVKQMRGYIPGRVLRSYECSDKSSWFHMLSPHTVLAQISLKLCLPLTMCYHEIKSTCYSSACSTVILLYLDFPGKYVLLVSSWARYLVKPLSLTLSPSRWRNSSRAGPADSLLYISSSLLWPAMQYMTPTFLWKLSCVESSGCCIHKVYRTVRWVLVGARGLHICYCLESCQRSHVDISGRTRVGIFKNNHLGLFCGDRRAISRINHVDIFRGSAFDDCIRECGYQRACLVFFPF